MNVLDMRALYKALAAERVRFHVLDFMEDLDEEGWRRLLGVSSFCIQNNEALNSQRTPISNVNHGYSGSV